MPDIFRDPTKTVPKSDPQIVRVNMEEEEIGGRKSYLPKSEKNDKLSVVPVPNR